MIIIQNFIKIKNIESQNKRRIEGSKDTMLQLYKYNCKGNQKYKDTKIQRQKDRNIKKLKCIKIQRYKDTKIKRYKDIKV